MASNDDDLQASTTEGYKLGEKKTVAEYAKLGAFPLCCIEELQLEQVEGKQYHDRFCLWFLDMTGVPSQ